jgi:2-oxo-3-hexenedioate decarboxylase/2-keto-4-pentenoate hydratase
MADRKAFEEAAKVLFAVRTGKPPPAELDGWMRPETIDDAYAIQALLNQKLEGGAFGSLAGYKIGCTTPVMQDYLGIPHPCAGAMFENSVFTGSGRYDRGTLHRPGVECEIAVDISADITALAEPSPEAIVHFVGAARASIELVDDRWIDFRTVSTPSLVSDNFFNAGCVLGPPAEIDPMTLGDVSGRMTINGREVGAGTGADILGHPLNALAWLAEHQIRRRAPLRAGQVVTLGSIVQTVWIEAGDRVVVEIDGLGRCALELARGSIA